MDISTIFRFDENLKKLNAYIPVIEYDNEITNNCKLPIVLYFPDSRILLQVFCLSSLPCKKDFNNRNKITQYSINRTNKYYMDSSRDSKAYMGHSDNEPDYFIRSVFLTPLHALDIAPNKLDFGYQDAMDIIFYEVVGEYPQDYIHYNRFAVDNERCVEVRFYNDVHNYFRVNNIPMQLLYGVPMYRISLRDAVVHGLVPKKPGVYALVKDGELIKIGKTTNSLLQRVKTYYDDQTREKDIYMRTSECINARNKDQIEIMYLECSSEYCLKLERILHFRVELARVKMPGCGANPYPRKWFLERVSELQDKLNKYYERSIELMTSNQGQAYAIIALDSLIQSGAIGIPDNKKKALKDFWKQLNYFHRTLYNEEADSLAAELIK